MQPSRRGSTLPDGGQLPPGCPPGGARPSPLSGGRGPVNKRKLEMVLSASSPNLDVSSKAASVVELWRTGISGSTDGCHSQTPPLPPLTPILRQLHQQHRGELGMAEKYNYDLSKAQLKASSRTSALLAGFAMVALVELQYSEETPPWLLIVLAVVTTLLVSVHLLALMMSTCILPYMEAAGSTQDSPHIRLKFYIDLSWLFSTCIGLVLFLVEIGVIFYVKFQAVKYVTAAYITTAMLVPVLFVFVLFSCLIHRSRASHSMDRMDKKVNGLKQLLDTEGMKMV